MRLSMIPHTPLQQRILDVLNHYAPTLKELQLNERALAAWETDARHDPTGVEAAGLADLLAVRRQFIQLYWCNTLARRGGSSTSGEAHLERAATSGKDTLYA